MVFFYLQNDAEAAETKIERRIDGPSSTFTSFFESSPSGRYSSPVSSSISFPPPSQNSFLPSSSATVKSFPTFSFSPPSHDSSLFPVSTVDSSEFLPSKPTFSSSTRSREASVYTSSSSTSSFNPNPDSSPTTILFYPKSTQSSPQANLKPSKQPDKSNFSFSKFTGGAKNSPEIHQSSFSHSLNPPSHSGSKSASNFFESSSKSYHSTKRPLEVSSVRFQCKGRTGYYGDEDFDCAVFHFCSHNGKRFTFRCGKGLTFNEVSFILLLFFLTQSNGKYIASSFSF